MKGDSSRSLLSWRFLRAAQLLFFFNVVVWLALGAVTISRNLTGNHEQVVTSWVIAVLMFGNATAMGLAGWAVARRGIWVLFALAVLGVNILLTFTDQVGFLDMATFAIDLSILGCWLGSRWMARSGR